MSGNQDFYDILGVQKGASKDEIKKSYRKLAMKFHPDRNPGAENEAKFKEVSEAASVLLDDQKRQRYDQYGRAGVDGQGGGGFGGFEGFSDLGDIFGDIFGDMMGGQGRGRRRGSRARAGQDLQMEVEVTFEEAAFGVEKEISLRKRSACVTCKGSGSMDGERKSCEFCQGAGEVRRQQGFFTVASTCPQCRGQGEVIEKPCTSCKGLGLEEKPAKLSVKIPPGIDYGQRLKLTGEGDSGQHGGPSGDLYVSIAIKEHNIFERDGHDVHCTLPISFSQAALGSEVEVPTLGGKVSLSIPAGSQSGKKMRLRGKGINRLGGHGIGDQIVHVHVETPTALSEEQKELFLRLSELDESKTNPMSKGFFDKVRDLFH